MWSYILMLITTMFTWTSYSDRPSAGSRPMLWPKYGVSGDTKVLTPSESARPAGTNSEVLPPQSQ